MIQNKNIIAGLMAFIFFIPTVVHALPQGGTGQLSNVSASLSNATVSATGVSHALSFTQTDTPSADSIELTVHSANTTDISDEASILSVSGEYLSEVAERVFDNDYSMSWNAGSSAPASISFGFAQVRELDSVKFYIRGTPPGNVSFDLSWREDAADPWQLLGNFSHQSYNNVSTAPMVADPFEYFFPNNFSAKEFKIDATNWAGSWVAISEIEVFEKSSSASSAGDYSLQTANFIGTSLWSTGTYSISYPASNVALITRNEGASPVLDGAREVTIDNLDNPPQTGSYYVTVATKNGGSYVDSGTTTFFLAPSLQVQAVVPQSFFLQIEDNGTKDNPSDDVLDSALNLGSISENVSSHPTSGGGVDGHQITVTTNAGNGYVLSVEDNANGLMRQGGSAVPGDRSVNDRTDPINDVIADYDGLQALDDGNEGYYFEVSGNNKVSTLNTYNSLRGTMPRQVIEATGPVENDTHTILYKAKVNNKTPLGVYEDVITYTAIPSF